MVVIAKCNTFAKQNRNIMINYNPNDKLKALDLANKLEFQETNITDNHMETCLMLFMNDNNGTWTIDGTYYGKYKLSYENERVCAIDKPLELMLDEYIENYRNTDEREQHEEEQYRLHQDEMLRNTNRNHFY